MELVVATLVSCPITRFKININSHPENSVIMAILRALPKTSLQHLEVGNCGSENFLSNQLPEMMGFLNSCKTLVGLGLTFVGSSDSIRQFGMVSTRAHNPFFNSLLK